MTVQLSTPMRNNMLDQFEASIGVSAVLVIVVGAQPANTGAADPGLVLATLVLPVDWMNNASGGMKTKLGTWQDLVADATGTAGHWRIYDSSGVGGTCGAQGSCTLTGGGGDMTLDNTSIVAGQTVTVTGFTLTAGNP